MAPSKRESLPDEYARTLGTPRGGDPAGGGAFRVVTSAGVPESSRRRRSRRGASGRGPGCRDRSGAWPRRITASWASGAMREVSNEGGSNRPGGRLARDHHVHGLPMRNSACRGNELHLPRVQDLPVPVVAEQLPRTERSRKRIRRRGRDVRFRDVGVHGVDPSRRGARLKVLKSGRPKSTREVVQGPRAKHHVHSTTQPVGPNVPDLKSNVDPEPRRPTLGLSDSHARDVHAEDPVALPGKVDRVPALAGAQIHQRAGRAGKRVCYANKIACQSRWLASPVQTGPRVPLIVDRLTQRAHSPVPAASPPRPEERGRRCIRADGAGWNRDRRCAGGNRKRASALRTGEPRRRTRS
jgi:hypothetical protein